MKLCVIAEDNMIAVDDEALNFSFVIDPSIWAIQWDGTSGHIEYRDIDTPNKDITDINQFQSLLDAHSTEKARIAAEEEAARLAEETVVTPV